MWKGQVEELDEKLVKPVTVLTLYMPGDKSSKVRSTDRSNDCHRAKAIYILLEQKK